MGSICLLLCVCCIFAPYFVQSIGPVVNVSAFHKTNFCDRAIRMLNGEFNASQALNGMSISTVVNYDTDSVYYQIDNVTGTVTGGLMYVIQQELAQMGNFTFAYHMVADPIGKSGTPYIVSTLKRFDLLGVYYTDSSTRRAANVGFTQGIVDASLVLITTVSVPKLRDNLWNFLLPFSNQLWWLLCGILVFNTVVYLWMENSRAAQSDRLTIFASAYDMWSAFTGGGAPSPTKQSSKLLNMGYFFVMIIMTATYTANMATFLILAPPNALTSITDAANQKAKVCVLYGSSASTTLKTSYPSLQLVINKNYKAAADLPHVFDNLRAGLCDGVVIAQIDWLTQSVREVSNPDCSLVAVDEFRQYSGAMPYWSDMTTYCTSLLDATLSSLIVQMKSTGRLDTIMTTYLNNWGNGKCAPGATLAESYAAAAAKTGQLKTSNMVGVFVVYLIFMGLAFLREIFERYVRPALKDKAEDEHVREELKSGDDDDDDDDDDEDDERDKDDETGNSAGAGGGAGTGAGAGAGGGGGGTPVATTKKRSRFWRGLVICWRRVMKRCRRRPYWRRLLWCMCVSGADKVLMGNETFHLKHVRLQHEDKDAHNADAHDHKEKDIIRLASSSTDRQTPRMSVVERHQTPKLSLVDRLMTPRFSLGGSLSPAASPHPNLNLSPAEVAHIATVEELMAQKRVVLSLRVHCIRHLPPHLANRQLYVCVYSRDAGALWEQYLLDKTDSSGSTSTSKKPAGESAAHEHTCAINAQGRAQLSCEHAPPMPQRKRARRFIKARLHSTHCTLIDDRMLQQLQHQSKGKGKGDSSPGSPGDALTTHESHISLRDIDAIQLMSDSLEVSSDGSASENGSEDGDGDGDGVNNGDGNGNGLAGNESDKADEYRAYEASFRKSKAATATQKSQPKPRSHSPSGSSRSQTHAHHTHTLESVKGFCVAEFYDCLCDIYVEDIDNEELMIEIHDETPKYTTSRTQLQGHSYTPTPFSISEYLNPTDQIIGHTHIRCAKLIRDTYTHMHADGAADQMHSQQRPQSNRNILAEANAHTNMFALSASIYASSTNPNPPQAEHPSHPEHPEHPDHRGHHHSDKCEILLSTAVLSTAHADLNPKHHHAIARPPSHYQAQAHSPHLHARLNRTTPSANGKYDVMFVSGKQQKQHQQQQQHKQLEVETTFNTHQGPAQPYPETASLQTSSMEFGTPVLSYADTYSHTPGGSAVGDMEMVDRHFVDPRLMDSLGAAFPSGSTLSVNAAANSLQTLKSSQEVRRPATTVVVDPVETEIAAMTRGLEGDEGDENMADDAEAATPRSARTAESVRTPDSQVVLFEC